MATNKATDASQRERVREMILGQIVCGVWPVGTRLDGMNHLAQRFGTSKFPVFQALTDLEASGHIVRKQ
jgi:DNA-binding GntR family transcriptional regulator